MMIRTLRRITHRSYLQELEGTYGSIERLERLAKRNKSKRPLLDEWKFLAAHPERADELLTVERTVVFHDFKKFLEIVSPLRLELLEYLRKHRDVDSLNDLARRLGRDYRNVYEDAQRLASTGVLELEQKPNRTVPKVPNDEILVAI